MSHRTPLAIGALAIAALSCAHLFSFAFRFLGPSSAGLFPYYAGLMLGGRMPYRDFFVVIPPLYFLKTAALMSVFGADIAALRAWEIATRSILGIVVYLWLARMVRPASAFIAAAAAIVVFSGDPADALTSYHHESVFWAVLAGFALSFLDWRRVRRDGALAAAAGFGASLAFLTKQTTGIGITFALAIAIGLIAIRECGRRGAAIRLLAYAAGWSIPTAAVGAWLTREGALKPFLDAAFVSGPASKGSLFAVLFRVVLQPLENPVHAADLALATLCAAVLLLRMSRSRSCAPPPSRMSALLASAALGMAALGLGAALSYAGLTPPGARLFPLAENFAIRLGFMGSLGITAYYGILALRRSLDTAERQRLLLGAVSFASSYMLSLSWPAYQPMACPSLALVVALLLEEFAPLPGGAAVRGVVLAGSAALLFIASYLKTEQPFIWNGWSDPPVRRASATSERPQLAGLGLAPEAKEFVDRLTGLIDRHSRPEDPIFLFSYEPMYYFLTGRRPPTFAQVHFFDVAPDAICRLDAERLLAAIPPVIVDFVTPPDEFDRNEWIFRQGARSGQRDLYESMYALIRAHYRMEAVLHQPGGREVRVFVRN